MRWADKLLLRVRSLLRRERVDHELAVRLRGDQRAFLGLVVVGLIFLVGVFPLTRLWPAGWSWGTGHSHYLMMILGVYATLGVGSSSHLAGVAFDIHAENLSTAAR